jgi:hypothetical protein
MGAIPEAGVREKHQTRACPPSARPRRPHIIASRNAAGLAVGAVVVVVVKSKREQQYRPFHPHTCALLYYTTLTIMTAGEAGKKTGGEEWDLTPLVAPYLDRHMVLPLLEFLKERVDQGQLAYRHEDLDRTRLELVRPTHMVDFAEELYRSLHGSGSGDAAAIPSQEELQAQKRAVYEQKARLEEACGRLDKFPAEEKVRACCVQCSVLLLPNCKLFAVRLLRSHATPFSFARRSSWRRASGTRRTSPRSGSAPTRSRRTGSWPASTLSAATTSPRSTC